MSAARVLIELVLEEPPRVRVDFLNSGDEARMADWLSAHPRYAELVERAIELGEAERAA